MGTRFSRIESTDLNVGILRLVLPGRSSNILVQALGLISQEKIPFTLESDPFIYILSTAVDLKSGNPTGEIRVKSMNSSWAKSMLALDPSTLFSSISRNRYTYAESPRYC